MKIIERFTASKKPVYEPVSGNELEIDENNNKDDLEFQTPVSTPTKSNEKNQGKLNENQKKEGGEKKIKNMNL